MFSYKERYNRQKKPTFQRYQDAWSDYAAEAGYNTGLGYSTGSLYTPGSITSRSQDNGRVQPIVQRRLPPTDLENKPKQDIARRTLQKPINKRGRIVTFFKDGDPHYTGLTVSISQKQFLTVDTLLSWLNDKISMTTGVRNIYTWPDGQRVNEIADFVAGDIYVASGGKLNRNIDYGKRDRPWVNKKMSAGKLRQHDTGLFNSAKDGVPLSPSIKPRVLTIISNTNRSNREKVLLNPQTNQTFEEILEDIGGMMYIDNPPVTALYTAKRPHKRVHSFSQLFKDFRDQDVFLACGAEGRPQLSIAGGVPPSSSTQSDTALTTWNNSQRRNGLDQDAYTSDFDEPPTHKAKKLRDRPLFNKVNLGGSRGKGKQPGKQPPPLKKQQPPKEFVRVDIHGKRKEYTLPSYPLNNDGEKPDRKLKLDWVYGYRGRDARNNLYVLPSGELLYYVCSVSVIFDKDRDTQRHYLGHTEDITSMALHPNQFCVATGQATGSGTEDTAHVRVWDARSLATYSIIGFGVFHVAVGSLAFSTESDGQYLLAVDESSKHVLSVWAWQEEKIVVKSPLVGDGDFAAFGKLPDTVVWASFHPYDDRILLTYGKQHVFFWKIVYDGSGPTRILRDKFSGIFKNDPPKFVTALAFAENGDCITGDSNGDVIVWSQDSTGAFVKDQRLSIFLKKAHKKSVFALSVLKDGSLLSGGGNELKHWDHKNSYNLLQSKTIPDACGFVRTLFPLSVDGNDIQVAVGTTRNAVLEGSLSDGFNFLVQGHSEELWALSVHPTEHTFVTAGYDQLVCKWSAVSHKLLWKIHVNKPCMSVAFDQRGKRIIVATAGGSFTVLDSLNGSHRATVQVSSGAVDSAKFSPDGRKVAMGSQDGNIYVYASDPGNATAFSKFKDGVLKGHKNFVMQLDWSSDSRHLQSVSGDYDLLYWDVHSMRPERSVRLSRDISWYTQSCVLGYTTVGAWSHIEDEDDDINTVCKSNYEAYMAVGDNRGSIRLFKHPAVTHKPDYHEKKLYSSHVTNVRFLFDDSYLISTGGTDAGLLQWVLIDA